MAKKSQAKPKVRTESRFRQDLIISISRTDQARGGYMPPSAIVSRADAILRASKSKQPARPARQ